MRRRVGIGDYPVGEEGSNLLRITREQISERWRYQCGLWIILVLLLGAVMAGIALSVTIRGGSNRRLGLVTPAPPVAAGSTTTGPTTTAGPTTTPGPTTTAQTTTPVPTTPPVPPIMITCPPDVTSTLGKPDGIGALGNAVASGGCTAPIVTSSDAIIGTIARRRSNTGEEEEPFDGQKHARNTPMHLGIGAGKGTPHTGACVASRVPDLDSGLPNVFTLGVSPIEERRRSIHARISAAATVVNPRIGASSPGRGGGGGGGRRRRGSERALRSPSFPSAHISSQGAGVISNTGVLPPDATGDVSLTQAVFATNSLLGTLVGVYDKTFTTTLGSFSLASMGTGVCALPNSGDPQVMYDQDADRWVLLEFFAPNNTICMFVSDTSDALGSYMEVQFDFGSNLPDYPKLGLWNRVYALTVNIPGPGAETMCVIDRLAVLAGAPSVPMFCSAPFEGPLAGFGFQAWTPVTVENGPLPPVATESSGTPGVGAVFIRHRDQEIHDTVGLSPVLDFLEIEHWSEINFDNSSYVNVRYRIGINDFDSSVGNCTSSDECIPTPTSQELDPLREVVMQRASYRYLPDCDNQQSLVGAFVSHANGADNARVRWFELRFARPTPSIDPLFMLFQEGVINPDSQHRFMGTAAIDGNGTIAVGYALSSTATWPSMAMVTRARNDPPGLMRAETIISAGQVAVVPSGRWGDYFSLSTDPSPGSQSRVFYFAGQRTISGGDPWQARMVRVRITGEVIQRTFLAQDLCWDTASCIQTIRLE
jgi:hypothetical protein